jgi:hypothetical protein
METFKKILKIVGITIVTLFVLLVILLVAFPAKSDATENASEDKVTPEKQEVIQYTPCQCASVSYKAVKNGGVDNLSIEDAEKLQICNEKMASSSFMAEVKICPSYLKLQAYYNNLYKY